MMLIKLNMGQFMKNYCHIGCSSSTWVSQNTSFTECFFSNFALINLDLSLAYLSNGGFLLQKIYNSWGVVMLVVSPNSNTKFKLMNVLFCKGWTGGLISNFSCARRSKYFHNIKYRFPNAVLNTYRMNYFEDSIFAESSSYPILYKSVKQLNETVLVNNYFFVGNKNSFWSTRFYEALFSVLLKSFNMYLKSSFMVNYHKYKWLLASLSASY